MKKIKLKEKFNFLYNNVKTEKTLRSALTILFFYSVSNGKYFQTFKEIVIKKKNFLNYQTKRLKKGLRNKKEMKTLKNFFGN